MVVGWWWWCFCVVVDWGAFSQTPTLTHPRLNSQAAVLKEIVAETGKEEGEVQRYYATFWERYEVGC